MKVLTEEKFKLIFPLEKPRLFQKEIIDLILDKYVNENIKHVILNAPTGIGKSVIAMSVARYFADSYFLTSQKVLQDQYVNDFKIPSVKGKSNYFCEKLLNTTCNMGKCLHSENKNIKCNDCPYYTARNLVYSKPYSVLNYQYFFNMARVPNTPQKKRQLLICDEGHNLETELINFATLNLNKDQLLKLKFGKSFLNFPKVSEKDSIKYDWLFDSVLPSFEDALNKEVIKGEGLLDDKIKKEIMRKCNYLEDQISIITRLKEEFENGMDSVVIHNDKNKNEILYKLTYGSTLAKKYLFPFSDYTLSMSATILSKKQFAKNLDLKEDEIAFINCPSIFPKENRKVYHTKVGSLSFKNKEKTKPNMLKAVKQILKKHENERGIIHTVNYEFANYIYSELRDPRLIMPKGKERDRIIEKVLTSDKKDTVLLSPSLTEGIDLKDDLSRFTVICKVPYGNLGDQWIKRRLDLDNGWYTEKTIETIIQMTGRSVRTVEDFAVGYILDSDFGWFFKKNFKKFPQWWKEAIYEGKL